MIADGDSSCYRKILDSHPYKNCMVEKIECRKHLLRNYCNKLREVLNKKSVPVALQNIVAGKILKARTAVVKAVSHRKEEDTGELEKMSHLKQDILNSVSHVFGEHKNCAKFQYFCTKVSPDASNYIEDFRTFGLEDRIIMAAVKCLSNRARSLLEDVDTNTVEQLNAVIARYAGEKE